MASVISLSRIGPSARLHRPLSSLASSSSSSSSFPSTSASPLIHHLARPSLLHNHTLRSHFSTTLVSHASSILLPYDANQPREGLAKSRRDRDQRTEELKKTDSERRDKMSNQQQRRKQEMRSHGTGRDLTAGRDLQYMTSTFYVPPHNIAAHPSDRTYWGPSIPTLAQSQFLTRNFLSKYTRFVAAASPIRPGARKYWDFPYIPTGLHMRILGRNWISKYWYSGLVKAGTRVRISSMDNIREHKATQIPLLGLATPSWNFTRQHREARPVDSESSTTWRSQPRESASSRSWWSFTRQHREARPVYSESSTTWLSKLRESALSRSWWSWRLRSLWPGNYRLCRLLLSRSWWSWMLRSLLPRNRRWCWSLNWEYDLERLVSEKYKGTTEALCSSARRSDAAASAVSRNFNISPILLETSQSRLNDLFPTEYTVKTVVHRLEKEPRVVSFHVSDDRSQSVGGDKATLDLHAAIRVDSWQTVRITNERGELMEGSHAEPIKITEYLHYILSSSSSTDPSFEPPPGSSVVAPQWTLLKHIYPFNHSFRDRSDEPAPRSLLNWCWDTLKNPPWATLRLLLAIIVVPGVIGFAAYWAFRGARRLVRPAPVIPLASVEGSEAEAVVQAKNVEDSGAANAVMAQAELVETEVTKAVQSEVDEKAVHQEKEVETPVEVARMDRRAWTEEGRVRQSQIAEERREKLRLRETSRWPWA